MEDNRNLIDEYKGLSNEEVFEDLSTKRSGLEVAIYNVTHDFNVGTIVRNANNFNVSKVHILGNKKYNRRGAMCTDKYLEICYWDDIDEFIDSQFYGEEEPRTLVAIENNVPEEIWEERRVKYEDIKERSWISSNYEVGGGEIWNKQFNYNTTLIFGGESDGLSERLLTVADDICEIPSFGSTRSVNVGVASGIAMYEWAKQHLRAY